MKIDVEQLKNFIEQSKQEEYYYILVDGKVMMFESDKDKYIPWCFTKEEDAKRFTENYRVIHNDKHYQYIKTLEKIENWR